MYLDENTGSRDYSGDTPKQLLARSKYALYKLPYQWTKNQIHRVSLLFQLYPNIEKAYRIAWDFRRIYDSTSKEDAIKAIQEWMLRAHEATIEHFEIACVTLENHINGILAFFNDRNTNAHENHLTPKLSSLELTSGASTTQKSSSTDSKKHFFES